LHFTPVKIAIGLRWGMSPRIVNWIYTAVVKPILLFDSHKQNTANGGFVY